MRKKADEQTDGEDRRKGMRHGEKKRHIRITLFLLTAHRKVVRYDRRQPEVATKQ
jgi:hypothetical protein